MAYNQLGLSAQSNTSGASNATWFVRDPDGMLAADSAKPDLYYHFDALGSIAATTNAAGTLVKRYAYEPYGEEINLSITDANPWRFAGGYYDTATGMLKQGTRYYMPSTARWTQRDPETGKPEIPLTLNPYAYVGADPINHTDPTGRDILDSLDDAYDWAVGAAGDSSRFARSGPGRCLIGGAIGGAATAYFSGGAGATLGYRAGSTLLGGSAGCGVGLARRLPF